MPSRLKYVAVVLGFLLAGEVLDLLVLVGAAITLAGIWLSTSKRAAAWGRAALGRETVTVPDDPPGKEP